MVSIQNIPLEIRPSEAPVAAASNLFERSQTTDESPAVLGVSEVSDVDDTLVDFTIFASGVTFSNGSCVNTGKEPDGQISWL